MIDTVYPTVESSLKTAVADFIYAEVDLIDGHRFDAWLQLFADPCLYWIPLGSPDHNPSLSPALVYDRHDHLVERVRRMTSGESYCQTPPSETHHIVSNVVIELADAVGIAARFQLPQDLAGNLGSSAETLLLCARSKQVITELHFGRETTLAATCTHLLTLHEDEFLVRMKKIDLLQMNQPIVDLTFIL